MKLGDLPLERVSMHNIKINLSITIFLIMACSCPALGNALDDKQSEFNSLSSNIISMQSQIDQVNKSINEANSVDFEMQMFISYHEKFTAKFSDSLARYRLFDRELASSYNQDQIEIATWRTNTPNHLSKSSIKLHQG